MPERESLIHASLKPVEIPAAHEVVAAQLRRAIHLGHLGAGERLPAERELAVRLGVSRSTLREALRELKVDGYVESRRGAAGGPFVAASSESQRELRARLARRMHEFDEIRDFRVAAEGAAAALAARRRDDRDLTALQAAVDMLSVDADVDVVAFRRADAAFHGGVAAASGNRILRRTIEDARESAFATTDAVEFRVQLSSARRDHQAIVRAIQRGEPRRAEQAMARHIERSHDELRAALGLRPGGSD